MNFWTCPKCGTVESAYFGQCLKCNIQLNAIKCHPAPESNRCKTGVEQDTITPIKECEHKYYLDEGLNVVCDKCGKIAPNQEANVDEVEELINEAYHACRSHQSYQSKPDFHVDRAEQSLKKALDLLSKQSPGVDLQKIDKALDSIVTDRYEDCYEVAYKETIKDIEELRKALKESKLSPPSLVGIDENKICHLCGADIYASCPSVDKIVKILEDFKVYEIVPPGVNLMRVDLANVLLQRFGTPIPTEEEIVKVLELNTPIMSHERQMVAQAIVKYLKDRK